MLEIIHVIACLALLAASIYWGSRGPKTESAFRFLKPFISIVAATGILTLFPLMIAIFVSTYSGAQHHTDYTRPPGWTIALLGIPPLLPVVALLPLVGGRPRVVALIAVIALLPAAVGLGAAFFSDKPAEQVDSANRERRHKQRANSMKPSISPSARLGTRSFPKIE